MEQLHNRRGEKSVYPFRSARFFSVKDEWWFAIRRGVDQGPYPSKATAKQALIEYLNDQFRFENSLSNTG